jgi:hypothetical protein
MPMDFPRQHPEPAPRSAAPLRAVRYVAVSVWIVTLFVGANAALLWVGDWLLAR